MSRAHGLGLGCMGNFFAELKRRHIYRVAAAYAVVAWVLIQLVNNVAPLMNLPAWAGSLVLILLAVGFPIALVFAWIHELKTPESVTAQRASAGPLDWALMGALIVVIALVSYEQLSSPGTLPAATASVAPASAAAQSAAISIAVLPFANLSGDATQEFFSDGMTEEITSALARVKGLTVIGRTSAFEYKGQNRDLRAIGQTRGVTHLIEGSVRKDGNRVRITAQLIRSDNAANLWSENYDRQLNDIFATQEDIAQAIAGALKVPLGLQQGETLVRDRTSNLDSYQQYLRAMSLYRTVAIDDAIAILEPLVVRDPDFAAGWALLARVYYTAILNDPARRNGNVAEARRPIQTLKSKAEKAAQNALRADPRYAGAYWALARVQGERNNWIGADDLFRQALALDPNDPYLLGSYGVMRGVTGHLKESLRVAESVQALEPIVPANKLSLVAAMLRNGQSAAAIPILETVPMDGALGYNRNTNLARAYAQLGRYSEAADALLAIPQNQSLVRREFVEAAARLIRAAPTKVSAPESLPAFGADLHFVYVYVGALDRVFEAAERNLELDIAASGSLWYPDYSPLRKTNRFKEYARKSGFVDYWKARGWPDLCRPMGIDDFVCD